VTGLSQDNPAQSPEKIINIIKIVTISFSTLLLPSMKMFARLLSLKSEASVPKLEHKPEEKTIEISGSE
jgi:hypothetical protein